MDIAALREAHPDHWQKAAALRVLALDAVAAANSGHSGMPMGMADLATVLFENHLKFDAAAPDWPDRDRFVLSNGHGSMLLYGLLHLMGYPGMPLQQIKDFRQLNSATAGHPEFGHAPGIETTTGPLGQGLANAVGMAIAEAHLRAVWGEKIVNHRIWAFAGDGCLMEGVSQEALALAGRQKLSNLIVVFDDNGITIDGKVSLADATDQMARFAASGWEVMACDGHDPVAIDATFNAAKRTDRPVLIAARTHIALGSSAQDTAKGHGALTDAGLITETRAEYGWAHDPFEIPAEVKAAWEAIGRRGAPEREAWEARLGHLSGRRRAEWDRTQSGEVPKRLAASVRALKRTLSEEAPKVATRKASEMALTHINQVMPETFGGSADLTGSNNTLTPDLGIFAPETPKGRYVHYGIREHGMAAAMNGIALHGGLRPYGGTFMCFTDYARPAMRLSALMGKPVVYVMTHDSIGLGEDGPTHQPVEHLAMLRATPNMNVFRPADAVETAEAWEVALETTTAPSVLALSRQGLPTIRTEHKSKNLAAQGAYVLAEAEGKRQAILLATGSEVAVAMAAKALLEADGIGTRVVSMPCWELFEVQDDAYRKRVLPSGPVRVAVEAGMRFGWDRWLFGERGKREKAGFIGMHGFGASAPAGDLYAHFGITGTAVADKVRALLDGKWESMRQI
ncbi:MAG: transketolase [Pseudomonadota bacterium]